MNSPLLRFTILFGILIVFYALEEFFPLRKKIQPKIHRTAINLAIAITSMGLIRLGPLALVMKMAELQMSHSWGLLPLLRFTFGRSYEASHGLPLWVETAIALILLDYSLYLWHLMNHRFPFLWRFHLVHHTDLDMDVTTASRFHFGELWLSSIFRSAQILLIGINPFILVLFETLITAFAQFHHSNIRLPLKFEKLLNQVFVTPRMHGVHHSWLKEDTDSHFSTIFSIWDRLHKTGTPGTFPKQVTIGVPDYRSPKELTLTKCLTLPFTSLKQKK